MLIYCSIEKKWNFQFFKFPELLLASYEDSSLDPDGVALVWNTKFKSTTPEFVFNCSVSILLKNELNNNNSKILSKTF